MTYRQGNHQPRNVYRGEQYIGVMFTAEDAALAVEALNGASGPTAPISERVYALIFNGITHAAAENDGFDSWLPLSERERFAQAVFAELRAGNIEFRLGGLALLAEAVEALAKATEEPVFDSCLCDIAELGADCPVHQGRRARGPKPPPVGPGCICDGSGRTCPRHGTVL